MRLSDLIGRIFEGRTRPGHVLFRVDAGRVEGLSYGHLSRCHILSQWLRGNWACAVTFLMFRTPDGIRQARNWGETVMALDREEDLRFPPPADAVFFDLPRGPAASDLNTAVEMGLWTVVIDDGAASVERADVVLNSSILASGLSYPAGARLLLGPRYFIMPDRHDMPNHGTRKGGGIKKVLVTMGGSDPAGLTTKIVQALSTRQWPRADFTVVLGPGFGDDTDVQRAAADFKGPMRIVRNPEDLLDLFVQSDLVICAGGRTIYELWALGVPALAVAGIRHEAEVVRAFLDRGLIKGGLTEWHPERFCLILTDQLAPAAFRFP